MPNRRSVRLPAYDYASHGAYFVTVLPADRACTLGDVVENRVVRTLLGEIVEEEWRNTFEIRQNVEPDEFVVMPNHLHGIIWITDSLPEPNKGTRQRAPTDDSFPRRFGTMAPASLSTVINRFKGSVTRRAKYELGIERVWQRGFYEHVIRSEKALTQIRRYIVDNPAAWTEDDETRPTADLDPEHLRERRGHVGAVPLQS